MLDNINKEEVFFITYEDVIKSPSIAILKTLILKYSESYKTFLNFTKINSLDSLDKFYSFFLLRQNKNILQDLSSRPFDYDKAFNTIYSRNFDILNNTVELYFASVIRILVLQKFVNNIYIWSENYDEKIRLDIIKLFGKNEKINYIVGDMKECIDKIGIVTCFVINDVEYVRTIIQTNTVHESTVMVANYIYNYIDMDKQSRLKILNINELAKENNFILTMFTPIKK